MPDEKNVERTLRPLSLEDFVGQQKIKDNLGVFIRSSRFRRKTLDHVLLSGPPGLGKTSLAQIIAREMDVEFHSTSGPVIEKQGDLAAILTGLETNSLVFVDEIHRLGKHIEETLYSAMEDFTLDIMIGNGAGARSMKINLPEFTLVGATTQAGRLSSPLRDRFGIPIRFSYYAPEDLRDILIRNAGVLDVNLEREAALALARRSRGTPRVAIRLLKRINDFAVMENGGNVDVKITLDSLHRLEVDECGLDLLDRRLLFHLGTTYRGGPVGISTLSVLLGEDRETVEDACEPFLIQRGFVRRTQKGRVLTETGRAYLNRMDRDGI